MGLDLVGQAVRLIEGVVALQLLPEDVLAVPRAGDVAQHAVAVADLDVAWLTLHGGLLARWVLLRNLLGLCCSVALEGATGALLNQPAREQWMRRGEGGVGGSREPDLLPRTWPQAREHRVEPADVRLHGNVNAQRVGLPVRNTGERRREGRAGARQLRRAEGQARGVRQQVRLEAQRADEAGLPLLRWLRDAVAMVRGEMEEGAEGCPNGDKQQGNDWQSPPCSPDGPQLRDNGLLGLGRHGARGVQEGVRPLEFTRHNLQSNTCLMGGGIGPRGSGCRGTGVLVMRLSCCGPGGSGAPSACSRRSGGSARSIN
mmetsp:Transcript_41836/g.125019  ORF Transcript_41836/g.125019 Transcript_41836/m.125019 type:complete len:315 (+) Transcript_41836:234-1178(+)